MSQKFSNSVKEKKYILQLENVLKLLSFNEGKNRYCSLKICKNILNCSERENYTYIFLKMSQKCSVLTKENYMLQLVGCLTSQKHASVSPGRILTDNFTCCHTEIEAADQTLYLIQSQFTDTGPTSPRADLIMPGTWHGSHWSVAPQIFRSRGGRPNHEASEVV